MNRSRTRVFLCGDVMTGRGIDQILRTPGDPVLYESWLKSAVGYVELAERAHGPIPRGVPPDYIWGDALVELEEAGVDARIINLETSVTARGAPWPGKGIHYRMHPDNIEVLEVAGIDCCVLANNHVLDWSRAGLTETLSALRDAGIATVGAGADADEVRRPAVIATGADSRVVVVAAGLGSSGIPGSWSAGPGRPGVWLLPSLTDDAVHAIGDRLSSVAGPGDITMMSIHWGPNWGYEVPATHRRFARALIDEAGVDVVHGHSSHHPIGLEVYRGRLILYGCGDLISDYEGIRGHDEFRPGLGLMYFVTLHPDGRLDGLDMIPMRLRRFRLERPDATDVDWLRQTLARAGRFGTHIEAAGDGRLRAVW